jgi:hypothetical protein
VEHRFEKRHRRARTLAEVSQAAGRLAADGRRVVVELLDEG